MKKARIGRRKGNNEDKRENRGRRRGGRKNKQKIKEEMEGGGDREREERKISKWKRKGTSRERIAGGRKEEFERGK